MSTFLYLTVEQTFGSYVFWKLCFVFHTLSNLTSEEILVTTKAYFLNNKILHPPLCSTTVPSPLLLICPEVPLCGRYLLVEASVSYILFPSLSNFTPNS